MAKSKTEVTQKDFSLGATRPDAIERDDTDLQNRSLRKANNTMILSTGAMTTRPGSFHLATINGNDGIEIEPADGQRFILSVIANGVEVHNQAGQLVVQFTNAGWTLTENIWVTDLGDSVLIGSQVSPTFALVYEGGAFTFGAFSFAAGPGNSIAQPYWPFESGITLTPSATTGSITLTTDVDFFSAAYIGLRIRYVDREIEITGVTDARNAAGSVVQELPPTKDITVASVSGFQIGEAVEHATLGGQGIITAIDSGTMTVTVLVQRFFTGFNGTGADLVGPNAKSNITAFADAPVPAGTQLWDEQLISPVRGYPGSAAEHRGRVIFCDFPQAANVYALSATGTINDYTVGTNDDDAIIDTISASTAQRVLHAVSAEDLIFLTSRGCYYQETRDQSPITPSTFEPVKFDDMGSSRIRPAQVHDGVVFAAANGQNIYGAILQGDIYKAWSLVPLSDYHSHLIKSPTRITATSNDSDRPERFIFVINGDGTAAIMRWERGPAFDRESVGWVPWDTTGTYKAMFMAYGDIHAIVDRTINNTDVTFLERFSTSAQLDAASGSAAAALIQLSDGTNTITDGTNTLAGLALTSGHLVGHTCAVWASDYDVGDYSISIEGRPVDSVGVDIPLPIGDIQIGLPFTVEIEPWARRSVDRGFGQRRAQRIVSLEIGVYDTTKFEFKGESFGGYRFGEDLTAAPARRTETTLFYPASREAYQDLPITKVRPGPFTMTMLKFRVQL